MSDELLDIVEEAEEELFPPRPGGLVDRHRRRVAEEKARADEVENEGNPVEERAVRAVKVAPVSPEIVRAMTYTIGAGQSAMILPLADYRYRAVVLLATAGQTVTLAQDSGAALGGTGFLLPAGVAVPVYSRAQIWAYNPGASAVQVSVLSELYAPEGGTVPAAG